MIAPSIKVATDPNSPDGPGCHSASAGSLGGGREGCGNPGEGPRYPLAPGGGNPGTRGAGECCWRNGSGGGGGKGIE